MNQGQSNHAVFPTLLLFCAAFLATACQELSTVPPAPLPVYDASQDPKVSVKTLLTDRGVIWGMEILPNGNLIFAAKSGAISLFDTASKAVTPLTGIPADVDNAGQGGFLDICLHPSYSTNGWLYMTYISDGGYQNLIRFKLANSAMVQMESLFKTPTVSSFHGHYGSRIAFGPDGMLYWSLGEAGMRTYGGPTADNLNAQDPAVPWGKIHRMTDSGGIPADNPVWAGASAPTTVYSLGHRNPQGIAFEPATGALWEHEHGPLGGCELNLIAGGANYGWPYYSMGINYDGTAISNGHGAPGITAPVRWWTPAMAPSGMIFIHHPKFRRWNGDILMGSLTRRYVLRVKIANNVVAEEQMLLGGVGRVRDICQAPDGSIYVSVEGPGRILQITAQE